MGPKFAGKENSVIHPSNPYPSSTLSVLRTLPSPQEARKSKTGNLPYKKLLSFRRHRKGEGGVEIGDWWQSKAKIRQFIICTKC